jgi:Cu/Ag efflux protein CusF
MKRRLIVFLVLLFAASVAFAQATKTHDVTGEVVKADVAAKTITLKSMDKEMTLAVEGEAATQLKDIKAGDKVTVSCRDDDKGAHKAVTKIVKVKAT